MSAQYGVEHLLKEGWGGTILICWWDETCWLHLNCSIQELKAFRNTSLLPGLDVGQHNTILLLLDFTGGKYMSKSHVE